MTKPEENWNVPVSATYNYTQPGDSCGGDETQSLAVEIHDAGGGNFVTISTERWALNPEDFDNFVKMLRGAISGKTGMREHGCAEP